VDSDPVVLQEVRHLPIEPLRGSRACAILADEPVAGARLHELCQPRIAFDVRARVAEAAARTTLTADGDILDDVPCEGFGQGVIEAVLVVEGFTVGLGS
jgi:hypothetical protein